MKLLDGYSPLDLLKRPLTIFNHEVGRMRWKPELPDLHKADWARVWTVVRTIILMIVIALVVMSLDRPTQWYFGWITLGITSGTIFLLPWLVGVVADLFSVSSAVTFWHARAREDTLDMLRLTLPEDAELLNSMRAVAELMAWRGMRWETALRAFLSLCMFIACGGATVAVVGNLYFARIRPDLASVVFSLCVIAWLVRLFMMYLREPMWRMRALVAMSILVASRTRDTNSAFLIASGIAMCLKLVQVTVAVLLTIVTLNTFNQRGRDVMSIVWFALGSLVVPWLVRRAYRAVHGWCTRQTLRVMQGAEG